MTDWQSDVLFSNDLNFSDGYVNTGSVETFGKEADLTCKVQITLLIRNQNKIKNSGICTLNLVLRPPVTNVFLVMFLLSSFVIILVACFSCLSTLYSR